MNSAKQFIFDCIKAIASGVVISFGATVFLMQDNRMFSSFLFSLGLVVVCTFGLNLYTGKVGYLADNPIKNLPLVIISWCGNFVGMLGSSMILRTTRIGETLAAKGQELVDIKNGDNLWSLFVLGIYCGILMYIAVACYAKGKKIGGPNLLGYLGIFLCVMMFIHCGFEHSIADMYYYMVSGNMFTGQGFAVIGMVTLGNAVGGVLFRALDKYVVEKLEAQQASK
ncbi:MAG: formate/nitrite transporter family protein [Oscillospiraceae bacterium]|nr:formate/nitrite transporter family protein [Oscillospiraceae bacterium]